MSKILIIAKNTFREAVRDRILYGIIAFTVVLLLSLVLISSLSLGEDVFTLENLGLAGLYIFSLIITIFLGASLIYKEIEKKTIYLILSKPVSAGELVVGKFFGLWGAIVATLLPMTLVYFLIIFAKTGVFQPLILEAVGLQILEVALVLSFLILFSTFSTPLASTIYSIVVIYIGHNSNLFLNFNKMAYYLLPNLDKFNVRNFVVHGLGISPAFFMLALTYTVAYSFLLLWLAGILLDKREI